EARCILSVTPADVLTPRAGDVVTLALTVHGSDLGAKQSEAEAVATPALADHPAASPDAPAEGTARVPETEHAATPVLAGRVGVLDVLFTAGGDLPAGGWSLEQE